MSAVIMVQEVSKRYADVQAVDHVSFEVERGEVFGVLGPNGAGKTTLLEMMEGLRRPDSGSITVLSESWGSGKSHALYQRIGVQLQTTALDAKLKVREALRLFTALYQKKVDVEQLLDEFEMAEHSNKYFDHLSGGQKQRLAVMLALVNDPEIIFLDELTTGLDPQARYNLWGMLRKVNQRGVTIVMTTHYIEEAHELCSRVAVIDRGRLAALDTPLALIERLGAHSKVVVAADGWDEPSKSPLVVRAERQGGYLWLYTNDPKELVAECEARGLSGRPMVEPTTLEDAYLALTGRSLRE